VNLDVCKKNTARLSFLYVKRVILQFHTSYYGHLVSAGELQVSQITHCDSLLISEITDEILRQLGVHYDAE